MSYDDATGPYWQTGEKYVVGKQPLDATLIFLIFGIGITLKPGTKLTLISENSAGIYMYFRNRLGFQIKVMPDQKWGIKRIDDFGY